MAVVPIEKNVAAKTRDSARPDTDGMSDLELAQAVLDRTITLRVGEARRLAEAVIAIANPAKKKKPGKAKKAKASKLPRIPGQTKKKKKKK